MRINVCLEVSWNEKSKTAAHLIRNNESMSMSCMNSFCFCCTWKVYYYSRLSISQGNQKIFARKSTGFLIRKFCDLWEILFTLDVAGFCMKNKDTHTKRLLLKKNFLVLKDFLGGGSCLIWYRRHEDRPASCWFRRKSWKYLGDTRIPVKLPFGQAFLKLCTAQPWRRLCQLGYSVLFIIFHWYV